MTTATENLRESIMARASGFREACFSEFTDRDFRVLQIALDVSFCRLAKMSDIRAKAEEAGIRPDAVAAALVKMDEGEMIFPCVDPRTGVECVEIWNFKELSPYMDVDAMQALR